MNRLLVLLSVLFLTISARSGELIMLAPLEAEEMVGCVPENGILRLPLPLPCQESRAPICIEAEVFQSIVWQNNSGQILTAEDAAGGKCVGFVIEAVYHFTVTAAGYYYYSQRVWIPQRASWNHYV